MVGIKVTVTKTTVEAVEAEFPIYRHHEIDIDDHPATDIWSRIDMVSANRFTITSLTKRPSTWDAGLKVEWEMEHRGFTFNSRDTADYALGRGEYACTPEEFEEAVAEVMTWATNVFSRKTAL